MDDIADVCQRADTPDGNTGLARFRIAIAARPDWQERLGAIVIPDDFVATALALAAEAGIALDRETVLATLNVAPIAVAGFLPDAATIDAWPPLYWLPARSAKTVSGEPAFDWLWFGPAPFADPFHRDWVHRYGFRPFGLMSRVRTDLATLVAGAAQEETLAPTGFIFHMSRCGSTLAAQMLAAVPDHIVMSEPEPVDAVVQWALTSGAPLEAQVAALRAVVAALGRNRSGRSSRYVLKLDAWHGFALPLFRAAFPDTPWLYLFRDPGEVLVSLRMQPGMQSTPGGLPAALIGFDPHAATSIEDYEARLFAGLSDRMLAGLAEEGSRGLAIHYPDLVAAMEHAVPTHFGFTPSAHEVQAMAAAATRDAKAPDVQFVPDAATKQSQVSPAMTAAIATWLGDRHAALQTAAWRPERTS